MDHSSLLGKKPVQKKQSTSSRLDGVLSAIVGFFSGSNKSNKKHNEVRGPIIKDSIDEKLEQLERLSSNHGPY
jgi:hypothetical protein